jgi:hypothetical protein
VVDVFLQVVQRSRLACCPAKRDDINDSSRWQYRSHSILETLATGIRSRCISSENVKGRRGVRCQLILRSSWRQSTTKSKNSLASCCRSIAHSRFNRPQKFRKEVGIITSTSFFHSDRVRLAYNPGMTPWDPFQFFCT